MSNVINIRGKLIYFDVAEKMSRERFDQLFKDKKERVINEAWDELLKATKRSEKRKDQHKVTPKRKKEPRKT